MAQNIPITATPVFRSGSTDIALPMAQRLGECDTAFDMLRQRQVLVYSGLCGSDTDTVTLRKLHESPHMQD